MKYALITNLKRDVDFFATEKAEAVLLSRGASVVRLSACEAIPDDADVVVTFGGDGTLLHAAGQAARLHKPIIGVNVGTLGYLTELEPGEIPLLERLEEGRYTIERRMMLSVDVFRRDAVVFHEDALNDAVVTHGEIMRVIPLTLSCDGVEIKSFRGDGVIAGSPTGSTAYSLSAGGPVVDPLSDSITLTPLNAHALYAKAFVFSDRRIIDIRVGALDGRSAFVSCDGREVFALASDDRIRIARSPLTAELIKLKDESFFKTLYQKL